MRILKFIFLIPIITNILSCSHSNIQNKLDDISTYVCSNPDSAQKELSRINKSELATEQLRAAHALLTCESDFFTRRSINDTILNVASEYFVQQKKGTASQQMETRLLQFFESINHEPQNVLPELLDMEKNIDKLSSPHFKGLLESFLVVIYYYNHEYLKMLEHAYKELEYAKEGRIISKIINSKIHIGTAYKNMNILDSAYIYYSSYKEYENMLEPAVLSAAYHNLAILTDIMGAQDRKNIENLLLKSISFNNRKDSARTFMMIADYYYKSNNKEKADSFLNKFYKSIRRNDYDSYYNISKTLNKYYESTGNIDSANKYKGEMLKYRIKRDSAIRAGQVMKITYNKEKEDIEDESQTRIATVSIIFAIIAGILLWSISIQRRKKNNIWKEYNDIKNKLDKILTDLKELKKDESEPKNEKEQRNRIASESQKHRFEVEKLTKMKDMYSMKLLDILIKERNTDANANITISEELYININKWYSKSGKGKDFVEKIMEVCPDLKDRELFICILYKEGINDDKTISSILNVTSSTFRTIKSRLRKKLGKAFGNCYVNEILNSM